MAWTDELVERVKELNERGLSASRIAEELGVAVSRNAVIGKLHRLGIKMTNATGRTFASGQVKLRERKKKRAKYQPPIRVAKSAEVAAGQEACDDPSALLSIDQLTARTCRWPYGNPGEPGFGYCGRKTMYDERRQEFSPWCPRHYRLAHPRPYQRGRAA